MKAEDITLAVCCNKNDYFLARICIASIRYYYPYATIELVKDSGNGSFNTKEIERLFNVKIIEFAVKKVGWGAAKFFYLYKFPERKKVLFLDADIVFVGPFIERLLPQIKKNDYVVSIENVAEPNADWIKKLYFDTKEIEASFPGYQYPGYLFNTGQIFMTTGTIEKETLAKFFDLQNYPYWKYPQLFPTVDQSLLNYLLPTLADAGKINLATSDFMIWSKSTAAKELGLNDIIEKKLDEGLIHWAGDLRTPELKNMTRPDILQFFESVYYERIRFGKMKMVSRKLLPSFIIRLKKIKRWIK